MTMFRKRLFIAIVLLCLGLSVYAGGKKEAPAIPEVTKDIQYISPNGDGIQDDAVLTFKVRVYVKSSKGFVPEYGVRIMSPDGSVMREIVQKEKSELGWFRSLFTGAKEFNLERSVKWDGKNDKGQPVPDGHYNVKIWVTDTANQKTELDVGEFVIDATAPSVTVVPPESYIFSPNADGVRDVLILLHEKGTVEDQWKGAFRDSSGTVVKTYTWNGSAPSDVLWDGTRDDGGKAIDGTYSYTIEAKDKGGNSFSYTLPGIILETRTPKITLSIDPRYYSPNGDGVKDTTTVRPILEDTEGVVQWSASAASDDNRVLVSIRGEGMPPESVVIGGTDGKGNVIPDGFYTLSMTVEYENGYRAQTIDSDNRVKVDRVPPEIRVTVDDPPIFSPNGDGRKDVINITMRSNEEVTWSAKIVNAAGKEIISRTSEETTTLIPWDGLDASGARVPDGSYSVSGRFEDRAGNVTVTKPVGFIIDTVPVWVALRVPVGFSPNNDGIDDVLKIGIDASAYENIAAWEVQLIDGAGNDFRKYSGKDTLPKELTWDGMVGSVKANDGSYSAKIRVVYNKGSVAEATSTTFVLDTTPATASIRALASGFSPNGDGVDDTIDFAINASSFEGLASWDVVLVAPDGSEIPTASGKGTLPRSLTWNGKIGNRTAFDGSYTAKIRVAYERSGKRAEAISAPFTVDTRPPKVVVEAAPDPFAKTDTGIEGTVFVSLVVSDENDIKDWVVDLVTARNETVRTYEGEGNPTGNIVWRSPDPSGLQLKESEYKLVMKVKDSYGNVTVYEKPVTLDILVVKKEGKNFLLVPNIIFGAYKHTLDSAGKELRDRNMSTLSKVAEIYRKYPGYGLKLEAHALNIYKPGTKKYEDEEKILFPLTERRAATVKDALVKLGMNPAIITTEAMGSKYPNAPVDDKNQWWKVRRVEFIMTDKK